MHVFRRSASHPALALRLGADWAGGADDRPPDPLGAAVLFAPAGRLIADALRWLRPQARWRSTPSTSTVCFEMPYALPYHERTVRSVANATRGDGEEFLRLAADIPVRCAVEAHPLRDANLALQRLKDGRVDGATVLGVGDGDQ